MSDLPEEAVEAAWDAVSPTFLGRPVAVILALEAAAPFIRADERRKVAEGIRVEMRRHDNAQVGFSAIGDAYANAALIAERGGQ